VKASTAFLHPGGMEVLIDGFARVDFAFPGGVALVLLLSVPRKAVTGHVSIMSMQQSLIRCGITASSVERGRGSPGSHHSHARKN
jgi:hypothetical protein